MAGRKTGTGTRTMRRTGRKTGRTGRTGMTGRTERRTGRGYWSAIHTSRHQRTMTKTMRITVRRRQSPGTFIRKNVF